jgi:hypothetical protein
MKFLAVIAAAAIAMAVSATRGLYLVLHFSLNQVLILDTVSYDEGYDKGGRSMRAVSCSDGNNGLITNYGWQVQSDIPHFPYIGGSVDIAGWNSPSVGHSKSRSIGLLSVIPFINLLY